MLALTATCLPTYGQDDSSAAGMPWIRLSAKALLDTNVARSAPAVAAQRGIFLQDFIYSPAAVLNLSKAIGQTSADLTGTIGYNIYQRNTVLNREFIDAGAGINLELMNCQTRASGSLGRQQVDLQNLTGPTAKNTITTTTVGLATNCQRTVGFAPFLSADREWSTESAEVMKSSNSSGYNINGGVAYNHPVIGQISMFGRYQIVDFPKRQIVSGGSTVTDGYDSTTGGIRYARTIGTKVDLTLAFSYLSLSPHLSSEPEFKGAAYDAGITYRPNWRTQIQLGASRNVRPATQLNSSYSVDQSLNFELKYALSDQLTVGANASRATDKYRGVELAQNLNLTSQTVSRFGGSVDYRINPMFAVSLTLASETRHADIPGYSYSSKRIGINLTVTP